MVGAWCVVRAPWRAALEGVRPGRGEVRGAAARRWRGFVCGVLSCAGWLGVAYPVLVYWTK